MVHLLHYTEKNKLNTIFTKWYRERNFKTDSKIAEYAQEK